MFDSGGRDDRAAGLFVVAHRSASHPSRLLSTPDRFARAYGPLPEHVVPLRPLPLYIWRGEGRDDMAHACAGENRNEDANSGA